MLRHQCCGDSNTVSAAASDVNGVDGVVACTLPEPAAAVALAACESVLEVSRRSRSA
eukprot:m.261858 g.261858  ORF g.261858 m.261858 type:complete len:57 (+) comp15581_c0_seq4:584-754(+)